MKLLYIFGICLFISLKAVSQLNYIDTSLHNLYQEGFNQLSSILVNNGSFKEANFISENCFREGFGFKADYERGINELKLLCEQILNKSFSQNYRFFDTGNFKKNYSIFLSLCDTLTVTSSDGKNYAILPFQYNFEDPLGKDDWSNMFVTTLLDTKKGNCHSLAYLYKILADEIGAKCWLSLAPNHIFIKNYSEKIGWYNTELTSGTFPTDAWVMVTGYVNPEAIKSGLYMDTLSNQQSIALCVLDLAKEYEFQTHNYYDGFILKCCDLVLQYHPVNPMALLLKAETLKKVWLKEIEGKFPKPTYTPVEMQNAYITLAKLGYREMPEKMYQQWLKEMTTEKNKYANKKVITPAIKK